MGAEVDIFSRSCAACLYKIISHTDSSFRMQAAKVAAEMGDRHLRSFPVQTAPATRIPQAMKHCRRILLIQSERAGSCDLR